MWSQTVHMQMLLRSQAPSPLYTINTSSEHNLCFESVLTSESSPNLFPLAFLPGFETLALFKGFLSIFPR